MINQFEAHSLESNEQIKKTVSLKIHQNFDIRIYSSILNHRHVSRLYIFRIYVLITIFFTSCQLFFEKAFIGFTMKHLIEWRLNLKFWFFFSLYKNYFCFNVKCESQYWEVFVNELYRCDLVLLFVDFRKILRFYS